MKKEIEFKDLISFIFAVIVFIMIGGTFIQGIEHFAGYPGWLLVVYILGGVLVITAVMLKLIKNMV